MTQNAFVRARINEDIKNQAAEVLADMGLTVSDACRILLTKVAREKQFPFDLRTPNAETREAIEEIRIGRGLRSKNADELFNDLGL
ncbi:MAG: type II toxin-antitoxin system RelB/DinJ family antitoxin [Candidatus Adiutrix sp.]|nr:type II toxin-antitoxin system RelB/DinJ family antitoxin [Candidatus Adiutrix sp.]